LDDIWHGIRFVVRKMLLDIFDLSIAAAGWGLERKNVTTDFTDYADFCGGDFLTEFVRLV
jgi:hypothetical protein